MSTPTFATIQTPFYTAHESFGSTPTEPRYLILRHEGLAAPDSIGFVFQRKSGRWGASVRRPMEPGSSHRNVMAVDIPRLSVPYMEAAITDLIAVYDGATL